MSCKRGPSGARLCSRHGGGSYSDYSKIGFNPLFRIHDISEYGETTHTYKRTENNGVIDDIVSVGRIAPPPFEGIL